MTTKELTDVVYKLNETIAELELKCNSYERLFKENIEIINKLERDIDMLKRWRG